MLKGPRGAPVSATHARLSHPEWGAARKIHAVAPRNDGVTNAAKTRSRRTSRPGMSVRLVAHAMPVPTITATTATLPARRKEFSMGRR